ncbi:chorismate mutase [Vagococcus sp. DIV0080]|uniref:Chorismate mutase n=1 Tax=Candidatus Vagococcus giribetii TaxID=2230876 RepID=A0ABS3HT48_9ENTE|nr:chorismate mutase [Vagococcus sp. DIV0080]MBO0476016.1 chorismate mutase [Vagococcus sp. DIV0080]
MLEKPRAEINQIDAEILKLLERRYACVDEVVRIKQENDLPTLDVSREVEVIARLGELAEQEAYKEAILETFQSMMDISRAYQEKKKTTTLS